jgi:hypothetical protein
MTVLNQSQLRFGFWNGRATRRSILCQGPKLLLSLMIAVGTVSASTVFPIIVFSDATVPTDYFGIDDSKITEIAITSIVYGLKDEAHTVDFLDNRTPVPICKECTYTETTGYTKKVSNTISSKVNAELGAKFKGIGATIGSSLSTTVNIGEEWTFTKTESKTLKFCATCEKFDILSHDIYDLYSGTYTYLFDDATPLHFSEFTGDWEIKVITGTGTEVTNYKKYECTPEPASLLLFGGGLAAIGIRIRMRSA